ncbi:hypothetical protein MRX96_007395 [Rhipicephalus microplus]
MALQSLGCQFLLELRSLQLLLLAGTLQEKKGGRRQWWVGTSIATAAWGGGPADRYSSSPGSRSRLRFGEKEVVVRPCGDGEPLLTGRRCENDLRNWMT